MSAVFGVAVVLAAAQVGFAGTPFGGDDAGTIPSDAPKGPVTKCENVVGKAVAKFVTSVVKCHASRAGGKLADDTAEDACEQKAQTKLNATKTVGCRSCTDLASTGASVGALLDLDNGLVYCTPTGTPFGGDDSGNISTVSTETRCEGNVGKAVAKLAGAVLKCHAGRVTGKYASDAAEDGCEATAQGKFAATKTTGCPSCINLTSVGNVTVANVDAFNSLVYCGSPSGAFLDAPAL